MTSRICLCAVSLILATAAAAQTPCNVPVAPSITFAPPTDVAVGQTYTIAWSDVLNPDDASGTYTIERSLSPAFATILDSQETASTSASFLPLNESGTDGVFHRVRAIPGCDSTKAGPNSQTRVVRITAARPNVVITVQPQPVFLNIGDQSSSASGSLTVENISSATVDVVAVGQPLSGSPSFFTIVDPDDTGSDSIALPPNVPKTLRIVFLNVATNAPASYQGFIAFTSLSSESDKTLAVTPYAFINLKVGSADAAKPRFRFKSIVTEYAFFDGYAKSLPDSQHPTITVRIDNPGTSPMQIGGEIGPETWLVPKSGWNANPIPAGGSIDVTLSADRTKSASPLPRYTYFTVRTKNSQSARLLVQDNDAPSQSSGRPQLAAGLRSYTVPRVVSADSSAGHTSSRLRLSNASSDALTADLFLTPAGVDGGDPAVRHAAIVVPPNDVVTLTDPLLEIFALTNTAGQMEVRTSPDRIASLTVTAETFAPSASGGTFGYVVPVVTRGEGARSGTPHTIAGLTASATLRPMLVLAETTGIGSAAGHAAVYDTAGTKVGELSFSVPRNGELEYADLLSAVHGPATISGRVDLTVDSGGGAVVGVLILSDTRQASAAVIVSQPIGGATKIGKNGVNGASASRYVISGVGNGAPTPSPVNTSTVMVFAATATAAAHFDLFYVDAIDSSRVLAASLDVPQGQTKEIANVMEQLFNLSSGTTAQGRVIVDATNGGTIAARLVSSNGTTTNIVGSSLPVIGSTSEALTSARPGMQRPIYFDGLEQSIDPTRGRRWDLLITEVGNGASSLMVRLYEAGNRTSPIAQKTISILQLQQKRLSTIFAELGLDTDQRRKDRTNVQVAILPLAGDGTIVVMALGTDNQTGDTAAYLLTPTGGIPATGVSKAAQPPPERRRAARH